MSRLGPLYPNRRRLLGALAGAAGLASVGRSLAGSAPAIIRSQTSRPSTDWGVAAGDVTATRATIWSRTDRPSRLIVEYSTSERFTDVRRVRGPSALEVTDFTSRVELAGLPPGQRVFYRVQFQDLSDLRAFSEPLTASFTTPPRPDEAARDVTLAWSADTLGQGWGRNPDWGGLRLYDTMARVEPDVFVHCGDNIYADQPLASEVTLEDGSIWRNIVTEAKSKVAETLDEFRGNYRYNLVDEHLRNFAARVPQVLIWDDHEVRDNWYETRSLEADTRYQLKSMALLAARAGRAFLEYAPIRIHEVEPERIYRSLRLGPTLEVFALDLRSYRGPNTPNRQTTADPGTVMLGRAQLDWLIEGLRASTATWRVVASDMPIGLVVRDFPDDFEAIANADDGPPLGRELEIAELLGALQRHRVRNVVWITGDVHYAAAHRYDPARARFTAFDPFWEFVAGPLHAGTFGPNALDATFGPEVRFSAVASGMKPNRPPSEGLQFFGTLRVSAATRALTARLHDLAGQVLFSIELPPDGA